MTLWRTQVRITDPILGGTGYNTWHLRDTGSDPHGAVIDQNSLMGYLHTWYSSMATYAPAAARFDFDGKIVAFQDGNVERDIDPWSVVGGSTTSPLPPANVVCVGWRTGIASRQARGRTFFGPLTLDTAQADGTINDAALTAIRAASDALVSSSTGFANGAFIVWSHKAGAGHDFTASATRDRFAVLRSRRD